MSVLISLIKSASNVLEEDDDGTRLAAAFWPEDVRGRMLDDSRDLQSSAMHLGRLTQVYLYSQQNPV
jgi:hypothetical protein